MKSLLPLLGCLVMQSSSAQSPYLSILVKMDSIRTGSIRYKIDMKICEIKNSEKGDWFTPDTSKIDFTKLKPNDLTCGKYFDKGLPTLISGKEEREPVNQFKYGNQLFAWEHVFVFKFSNKSSRGLEPEMYIVVPVKYKSFSTKINITDIEFQPGKVIYLTNLEGKYEEKQLVLSQSLKNKSGIEVKDFLLRSILEKE